MHKGEITTEPITSQVITENCKACGICAEVCPYNAITLVEKPATDDSLTRKLIQVNKAQCKGCGLCQGTCPKRGVHVSGFTMEQISAQIRAALAI